MQDKHVLVTPELHYKLKLFALNENKTVKDVVREILTNALNKKQ